MQEIPEQQGSSYNRKNVDCYTNDHKLNEEKHPVIHILGLIALAGVATHALYHHLFIFWFGADADSDREHYQIKSKKKSHKYLLGQANTQTYRMVMILLSNDLKEVFVQKEIKGWLLILPGWEAQHSESPRN